MLSAIHSNPSTSVVGALSFLLFLLGPLSTSAHAAVGTASDSFPAIAYSGTDGSLPWTGNWTEFGDGTETPATSNGQVRVVANSTTSGVSNCVATNCLRIGGTRVSIHNKGVVRQLNLSGASSATLKFTYRRVRPIFSLTTGLGLVRAEVSNNGGATWQTLASYRFGTTNDASRVQASFDITGAASVNTQIRFIGQATDSLGNPTNSSTFVNNSVGYLYVDDVKVDVVKPDAPPPPPTTGLSVSDSFASVSFSGSDGVAPNTNPGPWPTPWRETGETGSNAGPTAGNVRVVSSTNCAAGNCLRIGGSGVDINNRGVSRVVDLSGNVVNATLSFAYRRVINTPPTGSGSVLVQASPNGTTWTTLATIAFGAASDLSPISATFDIKSYAAAGTRIRFLGQGTNANGTLYVDNVKVAFTVNRSPAFSGTPYSFAVSTPATVGTTVGTVAASDPEGGAITYTITTDTSGGAFTLASPTLTIANAGNLAPGQYTVTVRATDPGGAYTEVPVTVTVTSNNQSPVFGQAGYTFSIKQTTAPGTLLGAVSASDPEGGAVLYSITAGNTGSAFAINPASGAINVSAGLAAGTFNLRVSATDPGGARAEVPVTVTVTDVTVNLKLLIISTAPAATDPLNKDGPNTSDGVLGYMQRFLEQAGVPYDVFVASATTTLTAGNLVDPSNPSHGFYNGIILTDSTAGGSLESSEWTVLRNYERDFKIREAVLSGWPAYSWSPTCNVLGYVQCDYDYGMVDSSWTNNVDPANTATTLTIQAQWNAADPQFPYVNKAAPWTITDFAWYATPRNDSTVTATPLLTEQSTGKALISRLAYADGREVLLSSIGNAWFLLYSEVLAREFVNFATKGVFVGGSMAYLNLHVDDLFLGDNLWDSVNNWTSPTEFRRLTGDEIPIVVAQQNAFKAAHPLANQVKLEFAFNGVGTGIDRASPAAVAVTACTNLIAEVFGSPTPAASELADSMANVVLYEDNFAFINHSYTHLDMDFSRNTLAGGPTTVADYQNEINCNRLVWQNLGLPEYAENINTMVTGEHSGIKDDGYHNEATDQYCFADSFFGSPHCVAEVNAPFPEPPLNVLLSDNSKAFPHAGNPVFYQTVQDLGLRYLASDASQVNQSVERFIRGVPSDRNSPTSTLLNFDQVLLPRYPTNVFYNVSYPGALVNCSTQPTPPADPNCQPGSLVDEYNNLFRERPLALNGGVDYCSGGIAQPPYQGNICAPRDYATILAAEADTGVRHILNWQMYPHFFHEVNLKPYDTSGSNLLFDWADAVMDVYDGYINLPVKSLPYWKVGQLTEERLYARGSGISGVWNVSAGTVALQANRATKAIVTGVAGSESRYAGQSIQNIEVGPTAVIVPLAQ